MSKLTPHDELVQKLDKLQEQVDNLTKRIATIEVSQMPYGPVNPYTIPVPKIDWGTVTCPACGLKLEGVMGYVCNNPRCPTGLGPVMC